MDKPISVGDLVQVVRTPKCGCTTTLGLIFRVASFTHEEWTACGTCRAEGGSKVLADSSINSPNGGTYGFETHRLKRIPPLEELDDVFEVMVYKSPQDMPA